MADHPSIQGLREAVVVDLVGALPDLAAADIDRVMAVWERTQRRYLANHGVGWFGEGLVRELAIVKARGCLHDAALMAAADDQIENARRFAAAREALVPVPQDSEETT